MIETHFKTSRSKQNYTLYIGNVVLNSPESFVPINSCRDCVDFSRASLDNTLDGILRCSLIWVSQSSRSIPKLIIQFIVAKMVSS